MAISGRYVVRCPLLTVGNAKGCDWQVPMVLTPALTEEKFEALVEDVMRAHLDDHVAAGDFPALIAQG